MNRDKLIALIFALSIIVFYIAGFIGGKNIGFTEAGARYYPIVQRLQEKLWDYNVMLAEATEIINDQQAVIDTWEGLSEGKIKIEIVPIPERIQ